ncbi:MAG: hypothetical protein AB8G11_25935 [Saprospiraceae bacterium]
MNTLSKHRTHLGKIILLSSIALFFSVVVLRVLGGFRPDEFEELLKLITPINALYIAAVIRYVIANPTEKEIAPDEAKLTDMYLYTSKMVVYGHLALILLLVWLFGLFHFVDFSLFTTIVTAIEGLFGIYAGWFLTHIFGDETTKNKTK